MSDITYYSKQSILCLKTCLEGILKHTVFKSVDYSMSRLWFSLGHITLLYYPPILKMLWVINPALALLPWCPWPDRITETLTFFERERQLVFLDERGASNELFSHLHFKCTSYCLCFCFMEQKQQVTNLVCPFTCDRILVMESNVLYLCICSRNE